MKLNHVIKPLHYKYTVDELQFRASKFEDDHIVFDVMDAGGLKVGEFTASPIGDDIEYADKGQYSNTLEMLRKTGNSSIIAKNVKQTLRSID